MAAPRVSVIIPTFNDALYIRESIQSILTQSYTDIEIIIVNDGTTDEKSGIILRELEQEGFKVMNLPNGKLAKARNAGIREAKGELICTLDADDKFAPSFLKKAVDILDKEPETGVVNCWVKNFGANQKPWRNQAVDGSSFLIENSSTACCLFRKKCWEDVDGYDENMTKGLEDWEFWIKISKMGWRFHTIPEFLFYYRKREDSMLQKDTRPQMMEILGYMMQKHSQWYQHTLSKMIIDRKLLNKDTLTVRRLLALLWERIMRR
jgi:glycosyltransferase involved in cell wall biosynthesis